MLAFAWALALLVAAPPPPPPPSPNDDVAALAAHGRTLAERFECNRCHEGNGLAPVAADKACVGCHAAVEAGTFEAPPDVLRRWQDHIVNLTIVPSLDGGARFRRDWIAAFLQRPHAHDLRPSLPAQMPRLAIGPEEARALAAWVAGPEPTTTIDPLWFASARAGRRLVEQKGCAVCHRMTGLSSGLAVSAVPVPMTPEAMRDGIALAPDLKWTRERLRPQAIVDWLIRPSAVKPRTAMPDIPLTRDEAEDIAAFLLEAPLDPVAPAPIPTRLPVLERRVGFEEVKARVFRNTCWHCHSEPDLAVGDGGPGNTGGFGFQGRGLSFVDYTAITAGSVGDDGARRSIFRAIPVAGYGEMPRLLAHLWARVVEQSGGEIPGIRGMPLGIPALSLEDLQLVESWIAQGRPE
ncbi:MAG: c-type cytochrome [Deltaproteobacteria bacterium]|nr:c-type cytochrome [Deltaproteobacteria bacterium]